MMLLDCASAVDPAPRSAATSTTSTKSIRRMRTLLLSGASAEGLHIDSQRRNGMLLRGNSCRQGDADAGVYSVRVRGLDGLAHRGAGRERHAALLGHPRQFLWQREPHV